MFKNSESYDPNVDSSYTNSEVDADKFDRDEIDDENASQSYSNNSYNEKQRKSLDTDVQNTGSNGHPVDTTQENNNWSSSFTVSKNWNYRSELNKKSQTRLKINLSKVKKVKVKKPSIGIARSKSNSSSPYNIKFLKKRAKLAQNSAVKKRPAYRSHQKHFPFVRSAVNGLGAENIALFNSESNTNEIPRVSSVSSSYSWNNNAKGSGNISDDGDANVGEYAQYLELKPSVKFKCYRCGINDFSSMATLQGHIATCSGPICNDSVKHSSPVRTMKPLASTPTASPLRITRKVFLCSSCGTYYQNYNLYIHMRDKHNKQICLFCRNIFSRSEQLWDHLVTVHKLNSVEYSSVSQIRNAFKSSFYITCCSCNSIFSDEDPFNEHTCDVGNCLSVIDAPFCTDCKPNTSSVDAKENSSAFAAIDSIVESYRRKSTSSIEEDESKVEFQNKFMSRDSTLDFIGVPEDHTVTSVPDEVTDVNEKLQSVPEKKDVSVPDVTTVPESNEAGTIKKVDDSASSDNDSDDHQESSPSHVDENESINEPLPSDLKEASNSCDEPLGNENRDNKCDSPIDDFVNNDDRKSSSVCKTDNIIKETSEADANTVVEETIMPSNCVDSDHVDPEDVKPNAEAPQHKELEAIPPPLTMALMLDETVDSLRVETLIKECVRTSCLSCLYCYSATLIAVNGSRLAEHLIAEHRFMPTKNEDDSQKVVQKLETGVNDLKSVYMNATFSSHREIIFDGTFACLQCSFTTLLFKDLCHHKRRTHHKVIFLCIMCKCNFQFYSQLLCHLCPGSYLSESLHTLKYHCCFCDVDVIPSAFRLMVHLRKMHQACDICLSRHADQSELYTHMIKQHKINHLCYKCNLAWRSRDDINKHLFWKHGTESVLCKRCLQKKWPHAYHFCIPASTYTCDECNRIFSKAVALTVHRRAHNGEFPFACDMCEKRCISKKLLAAHRETVHHIMRQPRSDVASKSSEQTNDSVESCSNETPTHDAHSGNEDDKDRRSKKKRKKMKNGNEKPLLDDLPPLNLSSESEDESAEEESAAKTEVPIPVAAPITAELAASVTPPPSTLSANVEPPVEEVPAETAPENTSDQHPETSLDVSVSTAMPPTEIVPLQDDGSAEQPFSEIVEEDANSMLIEKMLNCLIVEHSYCIPDSIFRSEVANQSAVSEGSDNAASKRSKHDKSCSKSITPRKRKHVPKNESSSSDSSTDSDSSSSSCGSNCSCNKSASNSSSSSSSESTTPEKRTSSKKKQRSPSQEKSTNTSATGNGSAREQSLLSVAESDLDTEVTVSDEDFYEEHPLYVPPVETKSEQIVTSAAVSPPPYENKLTITREATSSISPARNNCRDKKRKKKQKITISLGGIQRNSHLAKSPFGQGGDGDSSLSSSSVDHRVSSSFGGYPNTPNLGALSYRDSPSSAYSNFVSSTSTTVSTTPARSATASSGADDSGRLSKRKRVKNKFYGYSSSDENSGHESLKTTIHLPKKRPSSKKSSKSRPPFIGIRAKRPPNLMPRSPMSMQFQRTSSIPSNATAQPKSSDVYRISTPNSDSYRQQQPHQQLQQRNFLKPVVPESSDDSDSDEKRHKLVINLPNPKEKQFNHRLSYGYPSASSLATGGGNSVAANSWFVQRPSLIAKPQLPLPPPPQQQQQQQQQRQQQQQLSSQSQATPSKKEIYCYCRCPYDEVSEMIACDAPNCQIEWFHFECVGIMAAPKGQWFCPNCRKNVENVTRSF